MTAYDDYRSSAFYQEVNPDGSDGRVYWFAIHGKPGLVELVLMVGDDIHFREKLEGPAAHVHALHIADSWLRFAGSIGGD